MFGDEVDCQTREGGKVTTTDGAQEGGWDRAAKGGMMVHGQVAFGFVKAKYAVGLMKRRGDGDGPETIG
jgi:hypothetical protein